MTQQKQFAGTGDVSGQITGGARNGMNWDFMDQQGKVLTSIPYQDYVNNYQSDGSGAVRQGLIAVNNVPVYNFGGQARAQAPRTEDDWNKFSSMARFAPGTDMAQEKANFLAGGQGSAPAAKTGLVGGAIAASPSAALVPAQAPVTGAAAQTYTPQTSTVDRQTETAAGQVDSLLANDNPLLQRARTLARQGMAQRGLVNSSMAQGAGVAAMVDRITPIAQQDAQTYSNRSLANLDAVNDAGQFNVNQNNQLVSQNLNIAATKDLATAQQDFQSAQAELERAFQGSQQDKSIKAQMDLTAAQQKFQEAQNQLDRAQQLNLTTAQIQSNERLTMAQMDSTSKNLNTSNQAQMQQLQAQINATAQNLSASNQAQMQQLQMQIENNKTEAGRNYAATITLNATNQINTILADGNLDAAAKQGAITNLIATTNQSLQWASTFYNTNLPTFTAPGGTGTVINPGAGAGAAANNQFKAFVETTLAGSGTPAQKAAAINAEAGSKGFTREQISVATGYPLAEVNAYLAQAASAPAPTANTTAAATSNNATSSAAAAQEPIRPEVIREYVSANLSDPAAISAAAIANNVSLAELASSVGVSQAEAIAYFQNAGVAVPR